MATEKDRERNKALYHWYKSHNICTACKREKVTDGKVLCKMCRRDRAEYIRLYYQDHAEEQKAYAKKHREHCIANHLCTACAKPLPEGYTKRQCEACTKKANEARKRKRLREKWG